jgi:hypothetical protein
MSVRLYLLEGYGLPVDMVNLACERDMAAASKNLASAGSCSTPRSQLWFSAGYTMALHRAP